MAEAYMKKYYIWVQEKLAHPAKFNIKLQKLLNVFEQALA